MTAMNEIEEIKKIWKFWKNDVGANWPLLKPVMAFMAMDNKAKELIISQFERKETGLRFSVVFESLIMYGIFDEDTKILYNLINNDMEPAFHKPDIVDYWKDAIQSAVTHGLFEEPHTKQLTPSIFSESGHAVGGIETQKIIDLEKCPIYCYRMALDKWEERNPLACVFWCNRAIAFGRHTDHFDLNEPKRLKQAVEQQHPRYMEHIFNYPDNAA
jgi:hypothetical protein